MVTNKCPPTNLNKFLYVTHTAFGFLSATGTCFHNSYTAQQIPKQETS